MAINIDAIKKRLESLTKKSEKSKYIWKPVEGTQYVRIVPYQHQPENPFVELKFHYNLMGKTYLSPASFNKPDPIVELSERLKKSGDKDDWKVGRSLEPKMRTYVPIIVRGREEEGVKFWGFGIQVYEQLMSAMSAPDYGDITDLANGYDIRVEFSKKSGKKTSSNQDLPKITIMIKPKQEPVIDPNRPDAKEILKKITTEQPNILDIFTVATYEELAEVVEKMSTTQREVKNEEDMSDYQNTENESSDQNTIDSSKSNNIDNLLSSLTKSSTGGVKKEDVSPPPVASSPTATGGISGDKLNAVFEELFRQTK